MNSTAQAARESNLRLIEAAEYSLDAFFLLDAAPGNGGAAFRFVFINARAEDFLGLPRSEVIGRCLHEVLPLRYGEILCDQCSRALNTCEIAEAEISLPAPGISPSWWRHQIIPQDDGVAIWSRDITAHRQTEEHRHFSDVVFLHTAEGICVTDASGVIRSVNPAFTLLTGYSAAEIVGKSPQILKSGRHDENFYRAMWQTLRHTGQWSGEIWDRRKNGEIFPKWLKISAVKSQRGEISHFVANYCDIIETRLPEERLYHFAHHDSLTGLPNRLLFNDRLQQALAHANRSGEKVAVMFLDLDRLKAVNDTLGHDYGDILLQAFSERICGCVRQGDTVARMGGDEFTVVLPAIGEAANAAAVAEKILAAMAQPFHIGGENIFITPSIGISIYPHHGHDIHAIMKSADLAMYRAKRSGGNGYCFHLPG